MITPLTELVELVCLEGRKKQDTLKAFLPKIDTQAKKMECSALLSPISNLPFKIRLCAIASNSDFLHGWKLF